MKTVKECIEHLQDHIDTCDKIIAQLYFIKGKEAKAHRDFEIDQRDTYIDCIEYLKKLEDK